MYESLFIDSAILRVARSPQQQSQSFPEAGPATRRAVAFVAAVLVNVAVLGSLQWSADAARPLPEGRVEITQLETPGDVQLAGN